MTSWFQKSDFSAEDLEINSAEEAISYWNAVDVEKEDALYKQNDYECPWGLGIGMDTDFGIHLYRDDIDGNTVSILCTKAIPSKLLGFIPYKKTIENYHEGLSINDAEKYLKLYFKRDENLFT